MQYKQLKEEKSPHKSTTVHLANIGASFNPDKIPPSWQNAQEHELARQVGTETPEGKLDGPVNICDCCGFQVQRDPLPFSSDPLLLSFLGAGYPMFFQFIRYCIYILILTFFTSGLFNIITNQSSGDCITLKDFESNKTQMKELQKDTQVCLNGLIMNLSIANKKYHGRELFIQQLINLGTIIAIIFILQAFRRSQRIINEKADEANISTSDYTLMLKKVREQPSPLDYDEELKRLVEAKGIPGSKTRVVQVNLCYDLTELQQHEQLKAKAISQYQIALKYKLRNNQFPDNQTEQFYKNEIDKELREIAKLEEIFDQGKTDKFCGTAFISFQTEDDKEKVYEAHRTKGNICKRVEPAEHQLQFLEGKIVVELAPEPNDVLWQNQNVTTKSKIQRRIISTLVTLFMMLLSFGLILYLNKVQIDMAANSEKQNSPIEKIMGFAISMAIIVVNIIISIVIGLMANFEAYSTVTRQNISIAQKNIIAQFFNIAVILFVVSYYFRKNIIGVGGLIANVTMVFITNMIIPPIKEAVCIPYIINRLKLWMSKKQGANSVLTQIQANKLHERPVFPIAVYYGEVVKIMFFTAFYAPIIPLGMVFSIILLVMLYFVFKYNLLRRFCVLNSQSNELSVEMIEMQQYYFVYLMEGWNQSALYIPPLIGSFHLFLRILKAIIQNTKTRVMNIIQRSLSFRLSGFIYKLFLQSVFSLGLGVINALLPMQDINERLFNIDQFKAASLSSNYQQVEHDFDTNYDIENPATSTKAKALRVKKMEEQHRGS